MYNVYLELTFYRKGGGIFAKSLCSHITNSTDKQTKIILKTFEAAFWRVLRTSSPAITNCMIV